MIRGRRERLLRAQPIIFDWDPTDDPDGNWQHVFEGHDVEPEEVEALIEDYWDIKAARVDRPDGSSTIAGTSIFGRTLEVVFRVAHGDPPRVRVITCFPLDW